MSDERPAQPSDVEAILRGRHGNPFSVLGMHGGEGQPLSVNVFMPQAGTISVLDAESGAVVAELEKIDREGFFSSYLKGRKKRFAYRLRVTAGNQQWEVEDPYRFPPVLGELDEYLMAEGKHLTFTRGSARSRLRLKVLRVFHFVYGRRMRAG